jgi:Putative Ig domain/Abnormal spindle-like microcephaly-assoc'd, ASPM-SPD-2-Hydin
VLAESRFFGGSDGSKGLGRMAKRDIRRAIALGSGLLLATSAMVAAVGVVAPRPVSASTTQTDGATRGADNLRTDWYPDQTALTPSSVTGGSFGRIFQTSVNGEIYSQPLLDDNQLLVTTQNDFAYGLDPVTGAILWTRQFGSPVPASTLGCNDEDVYGAQSTAVVDQSTNTEYLAELQFVSGSSGPEAFYMHALNLSNNGAEEAGFPVEIQGTAANDPSQVFTPTLENQRAGLLLLGGVVYAAFSSHCDIGGYQGWIAGVSEAGALTTMWTDSASGTSAGAGIWMSGGGLVSDGPGTILFTTGNAISAGDTPTGTIPGSSPPANLGDSVVRLDVQPDGSLKAVDFFTPYDAASTLDCCDLDFGSGSPVALPDQYFGTASTPHLAVAVGKEGYVYLLNRDALGGIGNGPSGTDAVVGRYGPYGGVWSNPAVWPGDGGWVYIPTASGGGAPGGSNGFLDAYQYGLTPSGAPELTQAGQSSDQFGFGSSAPVVTSNGTTSGSALLWVIWSPDGSGINAQLRAYAPVPVGGVMQEVYSAPIGTASKFNPPGVGGSRIYVGTRDGNVIGFGPSVPAPLTATPPTFPTTPDGQSATETLTVTATTDTTVTNLSVASGAFTLGSPSAPLPATLTTGQSLSVPVTFSPTKPGLTGSSVTVTTEENGTVQVPLSATGESGAPSLAVTTQGVSFGGTPVGTQLSQQIGVINNGSATMTISSISQPGAPFGTSNAPAPNATVAAGGEIFFDATFDPTSPGTYTGSLEIQSNGGNQVIALSGNASTPPTITSAANATAAASGPFSFTVGTSGFPTPTLSESGGLPSGVTFTANANGTATLSGTPAAGSTGSYPLVLTATNGTSPDAVQHFTLQVVPIEITTASPLSAAKVGSTYSAKLSALGGRPSYQWKQVRSAGTLPRGIKLTRSTGVLSGTARRAGTFTFTVEVLDTKALTRPHTRDTATATFSITVQP